jgi:hypothetical protein
MPAMCLGHSLPAGGSRLPAIGAAPGEEGAERVAGESTRMDG